MPDLILHGTDETGRDIEEAAWQILGRILLPLGEGNVSLLEALGRRPTAEEIAAAIAAAAVAPVDLAPITALIAELQSEIAILRAQLNQTF